MSHFLYHFRGSVRVLFLDDLTCLVDSAVEYVLKEDYAAFTGGHGAVSQTYQPEWNVYAISRPLVSHKLQNLDPLLEVQVLLRRYNVDILVEVVGLLTVYCGGDITCNIQC